MKTTLQIMLASAFGILVGIALGKQIGTDASVAIPCGILTAILAFIMTGPKQFGAKLKGIYESIQESWAEKDREWQRLSDEEKQMRLLKKKVEDLYAKNAWLMGFAFASVMMWLVTGLALGMGLGSLGLGTLVKGAIAFVILASLMAAANDDRGSYILKDKKTMDEYRQVEANARGEIVYSKRWLRNSLIFPLFITYWCIKRRLPVIAGLALAFVRCFAAIASLKRYVAMVGSIIGFAVGWNNEQNLILGMLVGASAGAALHLGSLLVLKIMPSAERLKAFIKAYWEREKANQTEVVAA